MKRNLNFSCFYSKVQFLVIVGQHRLGDRSDHWTCSWRLPRTGIVENVTILGYDLLETVTQFLYASLQKNFQTSFHQTHSLEGIFLLSKLEYLRYILLAFCNTHIWWKLDRFPYFLPCLCTSLFASVVLASCIWMPVC